MTEPRFTYLVVDHEYTVVGKMFQVFFYQPFGHRDMMKGQKGNDSINWTGGSLMEICTQKAQIATGLLNLCPVLVAVDIKDSITAI